MVMTVIKVLACAIVCGGFLMNSSAAPNGLTSAALQGVWGSLPGSERMQLTVDAKGGARFEMDCASGALSGPITPSSDGKFLATGTFEQHQAGPSRADKAAVAVVTQFSGQLTQGEMTLSVTPQGASAPQVFKLREGARVKLLRCL
jgi:hypothetical protein